MKRVAAIFGLARSVQLASPPPTDLGASRRASLAFDDYLVIRGVRPAVPVAARPVAQRS